MASAWTVVEDKSEKKMPECNGQEGFRDLRNDDCEPLFHAQGPKLERLSNRTKKEKSRENWAHLTLRLPCAVKVLQCSCVGTAVSVDNGSTATTW